MNGSQRDQVGLAATTWVQLRLCRGPVHVLSEMLHGVSWALLQIAPHSSFTFNKQSAYFKGAELASGDSVVDKTDELHTSVDMTSQHRPCGPLTPLLHVTS